MNRCCQTLVARSHQAPLPMGARSRLTSGKRALLSGLSATSWAPHGQCLFLGDFHGDMINVKCPEGWSILTSVFTPFVENADSFLEGTEKFRA